MKLQLNLTIQFLLKQGQVELESTEIPDYSDAILINKSIIEELNSAIMVIYVIQRKCKLYKQPLRALLFLQLDT